MPEVHRPFYATFDHPFQFQKLEHVVCDRCRGERYGLLTTELGFEIRECRDCGLVYVSPQPADDELAQFYENMYPDDSEESVETRSLGLHEQLIRRILERRCPDGGRLLDAGCGFGRLLEVLEDLPWEMTGVEMSETAATYAQQLVPRAHVIRSSIEEAPVAPGSQDCITCIAVLEHMKRPGDTLGRLTEWLAPGGLLVVQVPRMAPFLKVKRWIPLLPLYFEAPRHLFDISPKLLDGYLNDLGYEDIRFDITPPYASPGLVSTTLIRLVKLVGRGLKAASGGTYLYPFVGSYVGHARKCGGPMVQ